VTHKHAPAGIEIMEYAGVEDLYAPADGRRDQKSDRVKNQLMPSTIRTACGAAMLAGLLTCACSPQAPQPDSSKRETWGGDLTPAVSVREVMRDLIDPLADNIFDAVGVKINETGTHEWAPQTDTDWAKVRVGAVAMAEGIYLLKIPRSIEPAGPGHAPKPRNASELSPDEIKAKIEKDPVLWQAKIEALRNVGKEVLDIVARKDSKVMFDAAEDLDKACENCHLEFWYPRQKEMFRPQTAKPSDRSQHP
jgi:hypothetical protein